MLPNYLVTLIDCALSIIFVYRSKYFDVAVRFGTHQPDEIAASAIRK
jgi:hypothetical protein